MKIGPHFESRIKSCHLAQLCRIMSVSRHNFHNGNFVSVVNYWVVLGHSVQRHLPNATEKREKNSYENSISLVRRGDVFSAVSCRSNFCLQGKNFFHQSTRLKLVDPSLTAAINANIWGCVGEIYRGNYAEKYVLYRRKIVSNVHEIAKRVTQVLFSHRK